MSLLLSMVGGAVTSLISEGFNWFKKSKENAHEIKIEELQQKRDKMDHEQEKDLMVVSFNQQKELKSLDIQEKDMDITSDQYTTALKNQEKKQGKDASFWDKVTKSVRPVTTYYFLLLFAIHKTLSFILGSIILFQGSVIKVDGVMQKIGPSMADYDSLLAQLWDKDTKVIFGAIISFWFTKQAFQTGAKYLGKTKVRS